MTNDPVSKEMQDVWQSQSSEPARFSPEDFRRKMQGFERSIASRNLREYVAAAIVVIIFGYYAWKFPTSLLRIGCALTIAGTLYVVDQLHRRAAARPVPKELALRSCVEFHRHELERQRDALRAVFSWYLLPFLPGICVFLFGLFQSAMQTAQGAGRPFQVGTAVVPLAVIAACTAALFVAIWWLNRWTANKLQAEIDELNTLARDAH